MSIMAAGRRIEQVRNEKGWAQQRLADEVNRRGGKATQGGIDKVEKRDSQRPRFLSEMAAALNVSEDWLRTGKGPRERGETAAPLARSVSIVSWVPAGQMAIAEVDHDGPRIAISDLDDRGDWIALRVEGDSMDRISPPGSIIIIDRKDRRLVPNACYVIADADGNATYKRYRPGPPKRFEPVSTNPAHEPIFPDYTPIIVGRVRKSIVEM